MDYENLETVYIKDAISKCEDLEELQRQIMPMLRSQQDEWATKILAIIEQNGYTKKQFASLCGVSRVSVDKWCKGALPKSRETFLRIGMVAGYDINEMNLLLTRYGKYPALYSKSLEDCVCIYVLNNRNSTPTHEQYQFILKRIKEKIISDDSHDMTMDVSTVEFDEKLLVIQDEDELEQFISNNVAVFQSAYRRLYAYIKLNISVNYMKPAYANSVFEMAEVQGWSSSLRQCVSAIRQNKWYPTRNKIISMGLHLSMDHEQIDKMLELAHMEPLCAKNIFESVIMFILDDASLNNMLDVESEYYDPDELCSYARQILEQMNLPEVEDFISELPEVDDD